MTLQHCHLFLKIFNYNYVFLRDLPLSDSVVKHLYNFIYPSGKFSVYSANKT